MSVEKGAVSLTRKLKRVYQGHIALVGDASGTVDAITGEGLCLSFRQAEVLAQGFAAGNLKTLSAKAQGVGPASRANGPAHANSRLEDFLPAARDPGFRFRSAIVCSYAGHACWCIVADGVCGQWALTGMADVECVERLARRRS